jgi:CRISPR-associated protein Cas2
MRRAYLVCYDIRDDKRLRLVAKVMRGFGDRVQYSVFRCMMGDKERAVLRTKVEHVMSMTEDHVLIVDLGPEDGRGGKAMVSIGRPLPEVEKLAYIL